jgi:hypothetical protein
VSVGDQQRRWLTELDARFGCDCVVEWASFTGYPKQYSPRLDLAVGPFSTVPGERLVNDYHRLAREHRGFLENLWECHAQNEADLNAWNEQCAPDLDSALAANRNARCFLAIEIENQVSRKHLMGGALNAVALGHLGIIIGWTEDKVRAMFRARNYLQFLERVEKPTIAMGNLLILSREQALRAFRPG